MLHENFRSSTDHDRVSVLALTEREKVVQPPTLQNLRAKGVRFHETQTNRAYLPLVRQADFLPVGRVDK